MSELLIEVEYRQDESRQSPGRLTGVLLPYEVRAGDRPELFESDALYWLDGGILIREMHQRDRPILRAVPFQDGNTVRIDQPFPDTTAGRDAATNLREGVYTGLSVEFKAERETRRGNLRVIQRARLTGAGLVDYPSYRDALAEVRQRESRPSWRRIWL